MPQHEKGWTRRHWMGTAVAALAASSVQAQQWPARPIRMVIPFPAGAGPDVIARLLADSVSKRLGQAIYVENRPGASANIGADAVAKSAPDGYTVLYGFNQIATMNPHLFTKLSYDMSRDLVPVSQLISGPYVLLASPKLGAATLKDLIAAAKRAPGTIDYASYGAGTASHLGMLLLEQQAGISMTHVPYRQGALADVTANVVSLVMEPITPALPWVRDGRLKALAVTGPNRSVALPDVPTLNEVVPGVSLTGWQGIWVRSGTPASIVNALNEAFVAALNEPAMVQRMRNDSVDIIGSTPEQMQKTIEVESRQWGAVIQQKGFKLD